MKAKFISNLAVVVLLFLGSGAIYSQNDQTQPKKENLIHIKMVKNMNGVETIVDTIITSDDFTWQHELPNFDIDKNIDSIMKNIHIEMINVEGGHLKDMDKQLMQLEGLKNLPSMKFDIRIDSNFIPNHKDFMQLYGLMDLKGLENLPNLNIDIRIDSNFKNIHDELIMENLSNLNLSNMRDTNVTIMILNENDAEYQKFMEELEKDKEGDIKKEKRVIIIQEECKGKGNKGEKMILEMEVILKTCNVEDLDKSDRKRLKNGERSFNEKLKVDQINFYPNPNNGRFNLGFSLEKQGDTEISIMDMNGKQVYNEKLDNFTGSYKKEIDISNNASGVYYIKVTQGKDSFFKKMIVQ